MKSLLPFLLLLQSPYCTFPLYVRHIYLDAFLVGLPKLYYKTLIDVLKSPHHWLQNDEDRGSFGEAKTSMVNFINKTTSGHVMNLVRLFPSLEHLHVRLLGFYYRVGPCHGLPTVSPTLKSVTLTTGAYVSRKNLSREWKNLLEWIRRQRICNISKLFLDVMAPWNMEGAEALLKTQGSAIKHLHIGPLTEYMFVNRAIVFLKCN
jgi:hypothetical protein